ncbi:MAG: hypothetical protein EBR62_08455, partial [Verrucomicrobia bacterium]|nr:hypothetical protein [Verrucomicrobiota bacterium]
AVYSLSGFTAAFLAPRAPAGAAASLYLMCSLPADTWIRLLVWMGIGLIIYFFYGRANAARVRAEKEQAQLTR